MEVISIAMKRCGSEASARAELLQALGSGSKSRVNKWLRAFKNLHAEIKEALHMYDRVPQTYVWDNMYLMGEGTKSKQRLGPAAALQSLALIQKDTWQQSIAVQHLMTAHLKSRLKLQGLGSSSFTRHTCLFCNYAIAGSSMNDLFGNWSYDQCSIQVVSQWVSSVAHDQCSSHMISFSSDDSTWWRWPCGWPWRHNDFRGPSGYRSSEQKHWHYWVRHDERPCGYLLSDS